MRETHGGDWAGFQAQYGALPLDFSASVSPLGLPQGVKQAVTDAQEQASRYPDPQCRRLRAGLARAHGVPPRAILCGSGAADLIYRLARALGPGRALLPVPTFSEYGRALEGAGWQLQPFLLSPGEDFSLPRDFLQAITPGLDLVVLCQPNNPTGRAVPPPLMGEILARCRSQGVLLMVDECFSDFLDPPQTLAGEVMGGGLLVLRAFTKFYAMAGLRLGYCLCGEAALLERMERAGPPWAVSSLAQEAGLAALQEADYAARLRRLIGEQRPLLKGTLEGCGCRVVPGQANFLLFFHPDPLLAQKLAQKGVLIRSCRDFPGLGPGWYRTAVWTGEGNRRLAECIKGCV